MKFRTLAAVLSLLALGACSTSGPRAAPPRDYLIAASKPDRLFVIDAAARAVKSQFRIPEANSWIGLIVPSPDGKVAYVLVNKMESIVGIDLDTGRMVFRADLSSPGERVKTMFAFDVTPDGRELIVHEIPTRLLPDQYRVEQTRFSVFDTSAGVAAKPVRQFPAPRRVHMVLAKKDGTSFYALGFELEEFDRRTGKLIQRRGIRSWERANHSIPDLLAFWPVTEPSGVFSSPVYSVLNGPDGPEGGTARTALMTLDLRSGELAYRDFEDTSALIFSTVTSPVRPEAFGVYTQLTKIDTQSNKLAKRVDLDHTYYSVNISTDGQEVYAGGAMCDIAIHDSVTLDKKGEIRLPDCGDQSLATLRVVRR